MLEKERRSLDIIEEQRDGSRRQLTYCGTLLPEFFGRHDWRVLSHRIILDNVAYNTQGVAFSVKCTMPFNMLSMLRSSHQLVLKGIPCGSAARGDTQLAVNGTQMRVNGMQTQHQVLSDLRVSQSCCEQT